MKARILWYPYSISYSSPYIDPSKGTRQTPKCSGFGCSRLAGDGESTPLGNPEAA